jgi:transcriptional regulator with XRE-family HTH domain
MLSYRELKAFRERRGLTVREVVEYAGMSVSTYSDTENGKIKLNAENHKKIVDGINKAFFAKVKKEDKKAVKEAEKQAQAEQSTGDKGKAADA